MVVRSSLGRETEVLKGGEGGGGGGLPTDDVVVLSSKNSIQAQFYRRTRNTTCATHAVNTLNFFEREKRDCADLYEVKQATENAEADGRAEGGATCGQVIRQADTGAIACWQGRNSI